MKISIDYTKIIEFEGGIMTFGYVPDPIHSKSGVTIAGGVDLGQRTLEGLRQLKLHPDLEKKLIPYLGLKQTDAVHYLNDHPLDITELEAVDLTIAVKRELTTRMIKEFNEDSLIKFQLLHPALQTIIYSLYHQYGSLRRRCPKFWLQATTGEIVGLYNNLLDFGDRYPTRRKAEARYLNEHLGIMDEKKSTK